MGKDDSTKKGLTEKESKDILRQFGVPVVSEIVAGDENEAVQFANKTGYPVVLKGLGETLLHKTERGLVHLNLADENDVRKAAKFIIDEAKDELEGILVQPQIEAKREFVAGMFRDVQFGTVIMFGLGGIYTEALEDVVFRLAPLSEIDALEMIDEIKSKKILGDFRGEKAADRSQLVKTLMGLSTLSMEHSEYVEIDINPLLIKPDGSVCAVDALIIKDETAHEDIFQPPVSPASIQYFFNPRPIAFVGASAQIGKWGHTLLTNTISGGFKGEVYLVNNKGGVIADREVYKSVADIPGKVDLAVVTIPAAYVLDLIPQFKKKGIKDMLLISSGFGETGEQGKKLEKKLVEKAREAGILILGPNTMGLCNPHINLYCTGTHVRPKAGTTLLVSQSGNMGNQLLAFSEQQGIGVRGFCGSGNEAMVAIEDILEAAGKDNLTKTIMLYIESVKNGKRFFNIAKKVASGKPIVLLKGGESDIGNKAASSHTGALSSDSKVFNAMCKQAGIIKVKQSMDMLDLAASFSSLPLPKGNRVAIMTLGGGWGVVTADLCSDHGLDVVELSDKIVERIDKILPPFWSRANPIDLVGENDPTLPMVVMEELMKWDGCDAVINLGIIGKGLLAKRMADSILKCDSSYPEDFLNDVQNSIKEFELNYIKHIVSLMDEYKKPVLGVSIISGEGDHTVYKVKKSP